jgi:hypothetical protein
MNAGLPARAEDLDGGGALPGLEHAAQQILGFEREDSAVRFDARSRRIHVRDGEVLHPLRRSAESLLGPQEAGALEVRGDAVCGVLADVHEG